MNAFQKTIQDTLTWFWELIDISDNLKRMTEWVKAQPRDFVSNLLIFIGFTIAALVAGKFALKFDFESTYNALDITREFMMGTITPQSAEQLKEFPTSIQNFNMDAFMIMLITIAPTVIEIFGASVARAKVAIVQLAVVALSVFDAITDIPTVTVFLMRHSATFDSLGFLSTPTYAIAFAMWLFLSTFGFELLTVIFAWAALAGLIRAVDALSKGNIMGATQTK